MARRSTILGRAKLERKLKRLPVAAKEANRAAMASAADDITDMMRSLVPYKTGALHLVSGEHPVTPARVFG